MSRSLLVTFGTRNFRPRQTILHLSARHSGAVTDDWPCNPDVLRAEGFYRDVPWAESEPRGAGFWSWKPFLIRRALERLSPGDLVVYSDVGRMVYPLVLVHSLDPFERWMEERRQPFLPGTMIPWWGANRVWTKRDCFVLLGADTAECHETSQVQSGFSMWRHDPASFSFLDEWAERSRDIRIIGDGPNVCGLPDLPGFREHRHDQSILSTLLAQRGLSSLGDPGWTSMPFDTRSIDEALRWLGASSSSSTAVRATLAARFVYAPLEGRLRAVRRLIRRE